VFSGGCCCVRCQNDPLYLRTFTGSNPSTASSPSCVPFGPASLNPAALGPLNWNNDQGLKFHYIVHTSLDAIEEKSQHTRTQRADAEATCGRASVHGISSLTAPLRCLSRAPANKSKRTAASLPGDLYLGQLSATEEYKMSVCRCRDAHHFCMSYHRWRPHAHLLMCSAVRVPVCVCHSYGYQTNTRVKLLVVLQDCSQDVNLKSWFRDLHTLYLATMCNPFADWNAPIQNPTFEQNMHKLVKNCEARTHTQGRSRRAAVGCTPRRVGWLPCLTCCWHGWGGSWCAPAAGFYVERK